MSKTVYKYGDKLWLVALRCKVATPPTATIKEVLYVRQAKLPGSHSVKYQGQKWPMRVRGSELLLSPIEARKRLQVLVENAVNEHVYQIDQLWHALSAVDREIIIAWDDPPKS